MRAEGTGLDTGKLRSRGGMTILRAVKAFAEHCERNKKPILAVLRDELARATDVLEIGSGTGQHAVYFARHMPWLVWQPSDLGANHASIRAWIDDSGLDRVRAPLVVDLTDDAWPVAQCDAVFSANTAHIVSWPLVDALVRGAGRTLTAGGALCLYGPFRFERRHTSASNEDFDRFLRARDPASGIRDFEAIDAVARDAGLEATARHAMPANNFVLVWRRPAPSEDGSRRR